MRSWVNRYLKAFMAINTHFMPNPVVRLLFNTPHQPNHRPITNSFFKNNRAPNRLNMSSGLTVKNMKLSLGKPIKPSNFLSDAPLPNNYRSGHQQKDYSG